MSLSGSVAGGTYMDKATREKIIREECDRLAAADRAERAARDHELAELDLGDEQQLLAAETRGDLMDPGGSISGDSLGVASDPGTAGASPAHTAVSEREPKSPRRGTP